MTFKDFVKIEMPEFKFNWHHDIICNQIDSLLFDENAPSNLMILAPPRSSKSTLCSILLPRYIDNLSSDNLICFSHDQRIADRREHDFEKICGHRDNIRFYGISSSITGSSIKYGIIEDDCPIIYREDGNRLWDWYHNEYLNRKSKSAKTVLVCSNSKYSLANHIIKKDRELWTVIRIPAIITPIVATSTVMEKSYWEDKHKICDFMDNKNISGEYWKYMFQQEINNNVL